ncbi:hypothetical protein B0H13DRAFT_1920820 [Mycena leptocephala]|nr:hypothetical protein B0H13DRAFT_1920820 [Mycena leptocephala]
MAVAAIVAMRLVVLRLHWTSKEKKQAPWPDFGEVEPSTPAKPMSFSFWIFTTGTAQLSGQWFKQQIGGGSGGMYFLLRYEFMGDMAFGAGFELMREGDVNGAWKIMEGGLMVQAYTARLSAFLQSKATGNGRESPNSNDLSFACRKSSAALCELDLAGKDLW